MILKKDDPQNWNTLQLLLKESEGLWHTAKAYYPNEEEPRDTSNSVVLQHKRACLKKAMYENFYSVEAKERSKKAQMVKRIEERVSYMERPFFYTQTLSEKGIKKDHLRILKEFFYKSNIQNWVVVTDYCPSTERLHYHCIIDLDSSVSLSKSDLEASKTKKGKDFFKFPKLEKRLGYNMLEEIERDGKRTLAHYCTKYMLKDGKKTCEHKIFASRLKNKVWYDLPF